jgi:hypothetical protein
MSSSDDVKKAHQTLFDEGMKVRKAVLGAAHVEKSMAGVSDFAMPIQHVVTEACWGAIWTRPGLERKTRSMLNIAMLTALNRYIPPRFPRPPPGGLNSMIPPEIRFRIVSGFGSFFLAVGYILQLLPD